MSIKVSSTATISFPQYDWGIHKGEERELPADKDAQAAILAHPAIVEMGKQKTAEKAESKK